ncbi:class I SAM-dependent methyltransferase [Candidatus Methylacidiphilum infernorum]|uniref:2-polyprenyl-3-methyl-5-hydroxy-6-metoxy-1, 4-benzoquinol methylase n=1 Tax=Methylacidiphilum infernorum (isolate V4) TaxID=481448 RepID=B3DZI4_METI4|nr:class I SAM-dependent methyltransferase [Candidatus Methylacidiphilum infernorum]ACD82601.1 2-polyprenyl-3-methyl-5-hydroxy-6-metoxy-1,4-benzoquinol methylase [Methylacidiphilum infernorum V4]
MKNFLYNFHPEKNIDHFTALDGTIKFYSFVRAIMLKIEAREILDFGAGSGSFYNEEVSVYRKWIRDLRINGKTTVTACDIDPVVLNHPCSDRQVLLENNKKLPFSNGMFDLIVSDMTFEHIENPSLVSCELVRVLKPGGFLCVRTPNGWGYIRLISSIIPNRFHHQILRYVQPHRKIKDIFPTYYRLNSLSQIKKYFHDCELYYFYDNAEPAYFFGSEIIYRLFFFLHKVMPKKFSAIICFFVKKTS